MLSKPSAPDNAGSGSGGKDSAVRPRLVAIYADESCLGNGRGGSTPGGAAGLIEAQRARSGEVVRRDYWISEASTTNNRMALRSVIEGVRALSAKGQPYRIIFTSDSRYLIDGLENWVHGWAARGWTRRGGAIENLELWREALRVLRAGGHMYAWRWVRGHAGHPQNEYANHLATGAAERLDASGGLVPSGFDAWIEQHGTRDAIDPFPSTATFVAARKLPDPDR